jgi:hypothetical protein
MRTVRAFIAGAGIAYLFDPEQGARRRRMVLDRSARLARRLGRWTRKRARFQLGRMRGVAHRIRPGPSEAVDDSTLLQRIRSEAFRQAGVSTKEVDVTVESGIVSLRGTVESATLADDLVAEVRKVPGVRDVARAIHVGEPQ